MDAPNKPKKRRVGKFSKLFLGNGYYSDGLLVGLFFCLGFDRYVSESSFVVRSAQNQASVSGLEVAPYIVQVCHSQDDTYTVREYMGSRSALTQQNGNAGTLFL